MPASRRPASRRRSARSAASRRVRALPRTRSAGRPPTGGSCFSSDSVAAIDQAVADGVDVINFSISGSQTNFLDSVEVAFLFAADAGVFVAASAGNSGPTTSTVAHPGPWLTTVADGTHNRNGVGSVTLGNGRDHHRRVVRECTVGAGPLIRFEGRRRLPGVDAARAGALLRQRAMTTVPHDGTHARSGQGGRQDRRLRAWRQRARQQEPGRAGCGRRGHGPCSTRRPATTPSSRSCTSFRRCTWVRAPATRTTPRSTRYAATPGATATITQSDDRA